MSSLNRATLIGNVGKDPEIRTTQSGAKIANLTVATSEKWMDKASGEKKERTEWHRITVFNENLVRIIENYVKKGSKIYIEGAIQTRKWQDQSGQDRYSTEIVLQAFNGQIVLLSSKNDGEPAQSQRQSRPEPGRSQPTANDEFDDEIPF